MDINLPLTSVKGIGEKTGALLERAGILTVRDLLYFLPRDYEHYVNVGKIRDAVPGKVMLKAKVSKVNLSRKRRGLTMTEATLTDDSGAVKAIWFNQPYRAKQFRADKEYYFSGELGFLYGRYSLVNPSAMLAEEYEESKDKYLPVYKSAGDLKPNITQKILRGLKPFFRQIPENLPQIEELLSRAEALFLTHFPETAADVEKGRERLAFEELFEIMLASELTKRENQKVPAPKIRFNRELVAEFVQRLPFKLTNAQRKSTWEILQDLEKDTPMNRLLQGDVGSGKTVVAAIAALQAASAGFQVALMAPTEILATQHFASFKQLGLPVELLVGSVKHKADLYQAIAASEAKIVVGTHALIAEKVKFKDLGLVIIDEQHRFGVKQRQKLLSHGAKMPHLLSMTATPIPRSLQLTLFAEMEMSILDELPSGRKEIQTELVSPNSLDAMFERMKSEVAEGRQVYCVCPAIEDNEETDLANVEREYQSMKRKFGKVGLLHGKMSASDKERVIGAFARGELAVLVSTTVVEVGVDVPNASVIVVQGADRFGLAQLHQLRGRVGRGEHQSYCFLVNSDSSKPTRRLQEIAKSSDGFYLAERDLELRGPGEIYGSMQHGALSLRVATITDTKLIARVQKAVREFLLGGGRLEDYPELSAVVRRYQRLTVLN
ncbi:MAG: ATP-dependent DNA helicase RecG [Candidatus Nomurabacteria bacterium]|jgi:ATP-dependent DNA helicase RecG|nr:ATP-dependent DNA helicase RecG [Candidatus Nomurabacteria bacterium]